MSPGLHRDQADAAGAPTLTAGLGPVPLGPVAVAHDAGERGVALQLVSGLAVERHHGAQLVVGPHPGAVHHIPQVEAGLPQLSCQSEERSFKRWRPEPEGPNKE